MSRQQPEEWRPAPDYEGLYEVSSEGNVRSLRRQVPHARYGAVWRKAMPKKLSLRTDKYLVAMLSKNDKQQAVPVHRLVARAFLGEPPKGAPQVNHKDGSKTNNRQENLEWVSAGANTRHSWASGLSKKRLGEANPVHKLTAYGVSDIRARRKEGVGAFVLALEYNISEKYIWEICARKTWAHIP